MTNKRRCGWHLVITSLATLGVLACEPPRSSIGGTQGEGCLAPGPHGDGPVALVSCPLGPPSDLRFFVGIKNVTDDPVEFHARLEPFGSLQIEVRQEETLLEPNEMWESASVDVDRTTYLLPRRGLLGRVIDLDCASPDFGPDVSCTQLYQPNMGRLEVRFSYEDLTICLNQTCQGEEQWVGTLQGATHELNVGAGG